MRNQLKRILSLIGVVFCTISPISAKHFTKENNEFLEIVLLDKYPIDDDFNSVMLYGDKVNNQVTNSLEYNGKKYSFNANERIIPENKIEENGAVFLEIQNLNAQNTKKCWADVVMYDIPILNNVSRLNTKYEIVRNFIH